MLAKNHCCCIIGFIIGCCFLPQLTAKKEGAKYKKKKALSPQLKKGRFVGLCRRF
jgi:hypothetical protein